VIDKLDGIKSATPGRGTDFLTPATAGVTDKNEIIKKHTKLKKKVAVRDQNSKFSYAFGAHLNSF